MTLPELIALKKRQLTRQPERTKAHAELGHLLAACEGREPTPQEGGRMRAAGNIVRDIDAENRERLDEIERLETELREDERQDELARHSTPTGHRAPSYGGAWEVGSNRDAYSEERAKSGERSFFGDMFNAQMGDSNARRRMDSFQSERATSTGTFGGLVVPQYLTDQAALIARSSRPFVNSVKELPLPEQGMSLTVPRNTTGAAVTSQATENSAVQNTDEAWSDLVIPVRTIAGQQDVSRQSLERGIPGIDQLIITDLATAYYAEQERQALSGSGSAGQILGMLNTAGVTQATAFTAAVTNQTFYTKVAGMISAVTSSRFLPPTHIVMHARRWAWLLAQFDSQGRPLVVPSKNGPTNSEAVGVGGYGDTGFSFLGLNVVVSGQVPTAVGSGPEDQVAVYRADDLLMWQDDGGEPRELRFDQPLAGQLTVKVVVYGYSAFTAARYPGAVGIIGGNAAAGFGLITPTF